MLLDFPNQIIKLSVIDQVQANIQANYHTRKYVWTNKWTNDSATPSLVISQPWSIDNLQFLL